jgi:hypothetical protein
MATQDYSNASALLRNTPARVVVDPTSRPLDLVQLMQQRGCFVPVSDPRFGGPEPFTIALVTSVGSTAERFVEGQAAPGGARRSFATPTLNAYYWREVVRVTGRMRDISAGRGLVEDDLLLKEQQNATLNMFYKLESDLKGSTVNIGLPSIIDDTSLYGGVDPGVTTVHASAVTGSIGTLAASSMFDFYEKMSSTPYNAYASDILVAPNQATNYSAIAGLNGSSSRPVIMMPGAGGRFDVGINPTQMDFQGIPLRIVRELTSTEILWPNLSGLMVGIQRPETFEPYGKTNDDSVGQVTMGLIIVATNRRQHGKMTGVTA